ncbi:DUF4091 domain-containing protein [Parabacteroides sp. OttesenSCG-928-G06]|nr:DUF4091 domain-containing protein [Parabacteroides sp. OttesenSCG-928-G06]
MKQLISFGISLLLGMVCFISCSQDTAPLWVVDPLEPLFPDTNNLESYSDQYTLDFPKGTVADVHIVLEAPMNSTFLIEATLNNKPLPTDCFRWLTDVPVEENTGVDSRTEQFKNMINPDVIRRAPFQVYEVLSTLPEGKLQVTQPYTALRLAVPAEMIKEPGTYEVKIQAKGDKWSAKGKFTAVVHPTALPKLAESSFFYTNWFNLRRMEEKNQVERWTEEWLEVLDSYAALMAHGRQNAIIIPGELISYQDEKFSLDEERMLQFIDIFRKYGFTYFESPHLMNRGDNDDWGDPELKVGLTKNRYYTPEGKKDIEQLTHLIKDFTVKNNLTHSWLQHISDEPTAVQGKCYQDVAKQIKEIYPEIIIMEATNDKHSIVGAVDFWCPLINDFQENEEFFKERVKAGERVCVYTCLIPGGKWLNRLLDQERLRQVYFGWGGILYDTAGYLHWGLNQYSGDPYTQSVTYHGPTWVPKNNRLPAGDRNVIYPEAKTAVSSTRFEAHRIGIEDYEILNKLRQVDPAKTEAIIRKVFNSYTDYSKSIQEYRRTRKELLDTADAL